MSELPTDPEREKLVEEIGLALLAHAQKAAIAAGCDVHLVMNDGHLDAAQAALAVAERRIRADERDVWASYAERVKPAGLSVEEPTRWEQGYIAGCRDLAAAIRARSEP